MPGGKPVGWIVSPSRRRTLAIGWDGRIRGKRVPDGNYRVRLVYRSSVLATAPLRIDTHAPKLYGLHADNGSTPFAGDNALLTTISPNGDGFREQANISFRLREAATVTMDVTRTVKAPRSFYTVTERLGRGRHTLTWAAASNLNPRTYLVRLTAVDRTGNRIVYGAPNAFVGRRPRGVVVRIQGVDAGFTKPNYLPGDVAEIHIATDAAALTERVFQSGPEKIVTYADNQFAGVEVDEGPTPIDWSAWRNAPHTITFRVPDLHQRPLLRRVHGGRRSRRLRAVRRAPGHPGTDEPRARDPADEHVAGIQLRGRERRRLRRHVVRRTAEPHRRPRPHVHRTRGAAAVLPLRPAVPALAVLVRQTGGVHLGLRLRQHRKRRPARGKLRPDRVRGPRGVRATARVRRRAALSRSRRQPDVPLGEQLLLEGSEDRTTSSSRSGAGATPAAPRPR